MKSWKKSGRARKRLVPRATRLSALTPEERNKRKRRNKRRDRAGTIAKRKPMLRIPGTPKEDKPRRRGGHAAR